MGCDIFEIPGFPKTKGLRTIDIEASKMLSERTRTSIKPGWKYCPTCRKVTRTENMELNLNLILSYRSTFT